MILTPTVGDIYCAYCEPLQQYAACQVTSLQQTNGKHSQSLVSIVQLDWSGDHILQPDELAHLQPLVLRFYFWHNKLDHRFVEAAVPVQSILIGNIPPLVTEPCQTYDTNWDIGNSLYEQRRWETIDEQVRLRFKQACSDQGEIQIGHQMIKKNSSTLRNFNPESAAELAALEQLYCLTQIEMDYFTPAILPFLQKAPFVNELHIANHDITTLDLSQTHLTRLVLHQGGLNQLTLNCAMEFVSLTDSDNNAITLHIDAKQSGRGLTLSVKATLPPLTGIDQLNALHIHRIKNIDLHHVATTYTELQQLRLWGKPGTISGLPSLVQLTSLHCLTICDLFGFTSADFPVPEQMPQLQTLWLTSLPAEAAKAIKNRYQQRSPSSIDLDISQPRKPEWLAENLHNPFRDWDGRDHIQPAVAKKAAILYKQCLKQIRAWSQQTNDSNVVTAQLVTMIETYTETFNQMDARSAFIDTIEREQIRAALLELLQQLQQQLALRTTDTMDIDLQASIDVFERTREF
ncbi:hypothetical protein [Paenibacillus campi]|uniref:hypothetical protein n=1 Tax=Paenibacillus campi TaxID=3106031 RepID=UPI002AFEBC3E|nr:hypothetical protein [Paenibacillus sp. SGZ-1014]